MIIYQGNKTLNMCTQNMFLCCQIWCFLNSSFYVVTTDQLIKVAPISYQCCNILFCSLGINDSNTFSIENGIPFKSVLGTWEMLHFSLSLMNRLNKTEYAIFIFLFWFSCSRGINFLPELLNRQLKVWLLKI